MKVHYNLVQGTPEWHEIKHGKIGGTRANSAFIGSDTIIHELASERTEDYYESDSFANYAMLRGQDLEPVAKERLEEYTGVNFIDTGWIDSDIPNVGISPDGISECETIGCEIKCPSGKKHVEYCMGDIVPKEHADQVLHLFTCNPKLETNYFCSFRPESKFKPLFVKEVTRKSLLDIGQKKKIEVEVIGKKGTPIKPKIETVPDIRTVDEWVKIAKSRFIEINMDVEAIIEKLKF